MRRLATPILIALIALAGCDNAVSPEQQIRAVITQIEAAVEARDVGDLMEHISHQYRDAHGQGPDEASRYVRGYFIAHQTIHLLTRIEHVEFPSEDEARAKVLVGMVGRDAEGGAAWDLAADLYEFDIALLREGEDWKVRYAEWVRK